MPRFERFSFACDDEERRAIKALAERLQRTQSDAVRMVVREAAQQLNDGAKAECTEQGGNSGNA